MKQESELQNQIDLLAERELNDAERDALFKQLDRDPQQWRNCAMALLESVALQKSIVAVSDASNIFPTGNETTLREAAARPMRAKIIGLFSTAAAVLFIAGIVVGNASQQNNQINDSTIATYSDMNVASNPLTQKLVDEDPEFFHRLSLAVNSIDVADSTLIAFVGMQNENNRSEVYPVIQSLELQKQIVGMPPPNVPRHVANQLERQGWRVEEKRHFVSLNLPDGKSRIVPVGMLNYHFVGRQTF